MRVGVGGGGCRGGGGVGHEQTPTYNKIHMKIVNFLVTLVLHGLIPSKYFEPEETKL